MENITIEITKDESNNGKLHFADNLIQEFSNNIDALMENTFKKPIIHQKTMKEIGTKFNTEKIIIHGYHRFYDFFLKHLRSQNIKMLEIGISHGKSLQFWLKYFPNAFIYSIDTKKEGVSERYHICKGDIKSIDTIIPILRLKTDMLDLVVDNGSHQCNHQIEYFNKLFPLVKKDGIYIIEVIETSYHGKTGYSCIDVFEQVIDVINIKFAKDKKGIMKQLNQNGLCNEVVNMIKMVTFAYNCIIIHKKGDEDFMYG